jgi:hypothetical protein
MTIIGWKALVIYMANMTGETCPVKKLRVYSSLYARYIFVVVTVLLLRTLIYIANQC